MQPTYANLKRLAETMGATIDENQIDYGHIYVDAPAGKVWDAADVHGLAVHWVTDSAGRAESAAEKREAIADVMDRMSYGLGDCDDAECDVCHPVSA